MLRPTHYRPVLLPMLAVLAACSDHATAPTGDAVPMAPPRLDVIVDYMAPDSTSADITVTSTGGSFTLGAHTVVFPANSICDPATSSYGPGTWDEPCLPATEPIKIHAEVRGKNSRAWIDFTPALRFVPTTDPSQYVMIYMRSKDAAHANEFNKRRFGILYMPAIGELGISEAEDDPTLITYVSPSRGIVYRRIKHFSGYNVRDRLNDISTLESDVTLVYE